MAYKTILYEKKDNIAIITLNRPEVMNALNIDMLEDLRKVFRVIGKDIETLVVIITGGKKLFCVGADISQVAKFNSPLDVHDFTIRAHSVFNTIERFEKPVIAAINGAAMGGGCELALVCDIRIASDTAFFGLPEIKIGVIPGAGGTQRLPRLIGPGHAKNMLFTGDPIDVSEAYRIGLVNQVASNSLLIDEAIKKAQKFASRPQLALRANKTAVNDGLKMNLDSALSYEARCFEILFSTQDLKEGMTAFIEKRKPLFIGK
jgi:enoyl-CoA hydratase